MEDSVLSIDTRARDGDDDDDDDMDNLDPPPSYVQHAANVPPVDSSSERRSVTFIASLNGSLTGPRDFVYYGTVLGAKMPALATNSIRLCTEPNNLPPGTDALTYPGNHQQIASVSGLHASIIGDRSPLLAAAFEDSSSGRRLHLETLSSNTVMPFLRFLYTGSYAVSGDWEDVPTSVLVHCKMYWLGDLYDLPELKSQAYVNVLRQFEFGCSSPEKPIDLCSAIEFAYKTLSGHGAISDAIVQYCVTRCLSHKLHEDAEFKDLAFNVRTFHQDLTKVCRDRGYEDESSAVIIRLPYKHFAPDTYASMEDPPIAGFHDVIHHFHSFDRFDKDNTAKPRQSVMVDEGQASSPERPTLAAAQQPVHMAKRPTPVPSVALPIRQVNIGYQMPVFAPLKNEKPFYSDAVLPYRQLDDDVAKLSTAPPKSSFFGRIPPPRDQLLPKTAIQSSPGNELSSSTQGSDCPSADDSFLDPPQMTKYRETRTRFMQKLEIKTESGFTEDVLLGNAFQQQQSHVEATTEHEISTSHPAQSQPSQPSAESGSPRKKLRRRELTSCTQCRERKLMVSILLRNLSISRQYISLTCNYQCNLKGPCSECCARGSPEECFFLIHKKDGKADVATSFGLLDEGPAGTEVLDSQLPLRENAGTKNYRRCGNYPRPMSRMLPRSVQNTDYNKQQYTIKNATPAGASLGTPEFPDKAVADAIERASEMIKRRKVGEQDRDDLTPEHPGQISAFSQLQPRGLSKATPSRSYSSRDQIDGRIHAVHPQNANTAKTARFTPSNVSPTLPPTLFGRRMCRPLPLPTGPSDSTVISAGNASAPVASATEGSTGNSEDSGYQNTQTHIKPDADERSPQVVGQADSMPPQVPERPKRLSVPQAWSARQLGLDEITRAHRCRQPYSNLQSQMERRPMQISNDMNPDPTSTASAAAPHPPGVDSGNHALQDYQTQLMLLERQNKKPAAVPYLPEVDSPNHALQDYQMQLMLLERQNKKRLLMARQEQGSSEPPHVPAPPDTDQKAVTSISSVNEQTSVVDTAAVEHCEHCSIDTAVGNCLHCSESNVLQEFDFDAFLNAETDPAAVQCDETSPFIFQERYGTQLRSLKDHNTDLSTSHSRPAHSPEETRKSTVKPFFVDISTRARSRPLPTNTLPKDTRDSPDSDCDMCESDSDSDASWVDVPMTEPKSPLSTETPAASGAALNHSKSPLAGVKRRSSSSDSEWDFC